MPVLRPITEGEFSSWLSDVIPAYADDKVSSGQWSKEDSVALSAKEFAAQLPLGASSPDNFIFTILDQESMPVGVLWYAVEPRLNTRVAYVYEVSVLAHRQREGHAYRAFRALEALVAEQGLAGIALHVFGHNTKAQALYSKLGFHPTNINLYKPIEKTGA